MLLFLPAVLGALYLGPNSFSPCCWSSLVTFDMLWISVGIVIGAVMDKKQKLGQLW